MAGYGDDAGFQAWLTANGYVLPETAPSPAVLRLKGSTYLDGLYGPRFVGIPTDILDQDREWPRTGVPGVPSDETPSRIVDASYRAAVAEALAPNSLSTAFTPNKRIVEVKAGSAGVRYSDGGDAISGAAPVFPEIEGMLAPFLRPVVLSHVMVRSIG